MSRRTTVLYNANGTRRGAIVSTSNNRERPMVAWHDLPDDVKPDFDYVKDEHDERTIQRFVYAYGSWFDVNDTEGEAPDSLKSQGWNVYLTTSFFDGYVFRHFTADGEYMDDTVVVGHFVTED